MTCSSASGSALLRITDRWRLRRARILTGAVSSDGFAAAWLALATTHPGIELELPPRSVARDALDL